MDADFFKDQIESMNRVMLAGMKAGQEIERLHRKQIDRFDYTQIPDRMMKALRAYTERHQPVGDFLQAVISNNLMEAFGRADDTNIELLGVYTAWLYNEAPGRCHGSRERYRAWIAQHDRPEAA